jgi:hypothetical protein
MKKAVLFALVTLLIMPIFTICSARASEDAGEKPLLIIAPAEYKSNVDSLISAYKSHSGKKAEVEYVEDMEEYSSRTSENLSRMTRMLT